METGPRPAGRPLRGVVAAIVAAALLAALTAALWRVGGEVDDGGRGAPAPRSASTDETPTPEPTPRRHTPRARSDVADAARPAPGSPAEPAPDPPHAVRVVVTDAATHAPVAGALVRATERAWGGPVPPADATTRADGAADVAFAPHAYGSVTVRARGFLLGTEEVRFDTATVEVALARGVPVAGRVVDADSRAPVAGAAVRAYLTTTAAAYDDLDLEQTTDADGRFEIAGVPAAADVRVYAAHSGYRTADVVVNRAGPGEDVELLLGDGGVLEGTVRDADGTPMAGVPVFQVAERIDVPTPDWAEGPLHSSRQWMAFLFPPTPTDAEGRYVLRGVRLPIDGVPQPRVAVARDARGREARAEPATFTRPGERQTRDITFAAPCRVSVRVTAPGDLPAGLHVRLQRNMGGGDWTRDLNPASPSIEFSDVRPGTWFVTLSLGHRMWDAPREAWKVARTLDFAPGERPDVVFDLADDHAVTGVVVGADGRPVPGITVQFSGYDETTRSSAEAVAISGPDGRFALGRLPRIAGSVEVPASSILASALSRDPQRFARVRVPDVVPGGPPLRVTVVSSSHVTGRVSRVPAGGEVTVREGLLETGLTTSARVDADGRFDYTPTAAGPLSWLVFEVEGAAPVVFAPLALSPSDAVDLGSIRFEPGLTVEGTLAGPDGRPLTAGYLWHTDPWRDVPVAVDAQGRFRIEHLPPRPLNLLVFGAPDLPTWAVTIEPAAGAASIVVGRGAEVTGRVLAAEGTPARGVEVVLVRAGGELGVSSHPTKCRTDAEGRFAARLQPGRWKASARTGDAAGPKTSVTFDLTVDGTPPVELRLR